ncbi:ATP-binding protein [Streptomyces fumigatiscleroticus]|nr:ATP-binding protein [Streptomyces fumigatiscleroticus]
MRIGQVGTLVHQAAPRAPVSWPHLSGAALPRRADCFQHRAEVEHLAVAVPGEQPAGLCQVLIGTGGMGKTQLAADCARSAWRAGQVDLLVWVPASSRHTVLSTYAQVGAEVAGADPHVPERAAERFLHWAESSDRRWLIVLDDVTDPADVRGLWPPPTPFGRTIVTTRRRDSSLTGPGRHRIDVGAFTPEEAAAYLTAVLDSHDRHDDPAQIAGLAADLGHLPLALSQAVAYVIDLGLDCASYRARLADHSRTLPGLFPDADGLPDDQCATVAATWSLSMERADRLRPHGLARPLLCLASMLDPNGIPVAALTSAPVLAYLATSGYPDRPHGVGPDDAHDALHCLHRLSLADHTSRAPHGVLRVHSLVQRVTRESLAADQRLPLARTAADALLAIWPATKNGTGFIRTARANAEALVRHGNEALISPDIHPLVFHIGDSLGLGGQATAAVTHFEHLAASARQLLGPDHHSTLAVRAALANWRGAAGDAAGAVTALTALLPDRHRVLGPDHPDTLTTRHHLANWHGAAGNPAEAMAALADLLPDRQRVLGPDHPDTLAIRQNLANWHGAVGDMATAEAALAGLLADQERALGPDHADTVATRAILACWRREAESMAEAAATLAGLFSGQEEALGPDHPGTLLTRTLLWMWRGLAGDVAEAQAGCADLLSDLQRLHGPHHPMPTALRAVLAYWSGETEELAKIMAALADLLPDRERELGPDHPDTLTIRTALAWWHTLVGDPTEAVAAIADLLADIERMLGPRHPLSLTFRTAHAYWRGDAAGVSEAISLLSALLPPGQRGPGPDHPSALALRHSLAHWQQITGRSSSGTDGHWRVQTCQNPRNQARTGEADPQPHTPTPQP